MTNSSFIHVHNNRKRVCQKVIISQEIKKKKKNMEIKPKREEEKKTHKYERDYTYRTFNNIRIF